MLPHAVMELVLILWRLVDWPQTIEDWTVSSFAPDVDVCMPPEEAASKLHRAYTMHAAVSIASCHPQHVRISRVSFQTWWLVNFEIHMSIF